MEILGCKVEGLGDLALVVLIYLLAAAIFKFLCNSPLTSQVMFEVFEGKPCKLGCRDSEKSKKTRKAKKAKRSDCSCSCG